MPLYSATLPGPMMTSNASVKAIPARALALGASLAILIFMISGAKKLSFMGKTMLVGIKDALARR